MSFSKVFPRRRRRHGHDDDWCDNDYGDYGHGWYGHRRRFYGRRRRFVIFRIGF